ncbi:WD40 repeat domain-containing protein [Aspergillus niger CBS 101883]|uniref:WD40 repeat domain-containing protein n=1 Tax=Aspergillus lacticoffeatus (strain CBS 101883) TaxID=1450533 RepID=UPI000D7FCA24|nr:WD40 repeat-like protein [Aspergillus niger CBS 101883]PYH59942.1 WD40 repeat-like protein [Aspergillus niger CBS 101883]
MGILEIIPEAMIADKSSNEMHILLLDTRRFILKFVQIADMAPLQLYSSGLIFAPHKVLIREIYERELPAWLSRGPKVEEYWDPEMQTLEGHSYAVTSVAFSNNGQLLASGSGDKTVKLWDAATGTLKHTLEGHSNRVYSVAFSNNGQLLASGSDDKTIKLWDAATGTLKHTLEGHSNRVYSVVFSNNGQLLASGSDDKTIKLWDAATGTLKHTLEGHSGLVYSVAFLNNGQLLASGSYDKTIKLWDAATGTLKHTLEGHSNWVYLVAFSNNGQLLASGSHDKTIKLWDAATGALKHDISTDDVATSIEFSEHLPLLISNIGSFDIRNCYESFLTSSEKVAEISLEADQ